MRLSGEGGQGIILAALILAEAAGADGINYIAQSQSYGPEVRGGMCKAEIVIDNEEIDYPRASHLDLLLAMNQLSCNAYFHDLKPKGTLVVDSSKVERIPTTKAIAVPFTKIAKEEFGKSFLANMIALGTIAAVCDVVNSEILEKVILDKVPKDTKQLNLAAFKYGFDLGKSWGVILKAGS